MTAVQINGPLFTLDEHFLNKCWLLQHPSSDSGGKSFT